MVILFARLSVPGAPFTHGHGGFCNRYLVEAIWLINECVCRSD